MPFPEMEQVRLPGERSRRLPGQGRSQGLPQRSSPQGRSQGRLGAGRSGLGAGRSGLGAGRSGRGARRSGRGAERSGQGAGQVEWTQQVQTFVRLTLR